MLSMSFIVQSLLESMGMSMIFIKLSNQTSSGRVKFLACIYPAN
jgi:hypothetical protein